MVYYQKIGTIIRRSTPAQPNPILTPEQIEKLKTVGNITLAIIAVAGTITLSAIAPNVIGALGKINEKKYPHKKFAKRERDIKIVQTFYYLKRSGQVRMKLTGNDFKIFLTRIGRKRLRQLNFNTLVVKKPSSWDRKWWQVAADIPTKKYRIGADLLRRKLKQMGLYSLQRTLWFYPYDPREEIDFIVRHYGVERFVTVMEINRLDKEDEKKMKKFFIREGILEVT